MKRTLISNVSGHKGLCVPVWVNKNQVYNRLDRGITGFFRLVEKRFFGYRKVGEEFHGIIKDCTVETTETKNIYDTDI